LSEEMIEKLRMRLVKNFMDVFILAELEDGPVSGYDVIYDLQKRFGVFVSSGTVYYLLYSMERDGLISGRMQHRKRVYTLTEKGEENLKTITKEKERILGLTTKLFGS